MKLYVKRVDAKSNAFTITVDNKETVASLKKRIGGVLDLFPDAIRLLHRGHPLNNATASLESCGIEDCSRISVVYVPCSDMNSTVSKVLSSLLLNRFAPNVLPAISEKYHISLARKIESFSLEELERYAKFRNQHTS